MSVTQFAVIVGIRIAHLSKMELLMSGFTVTPAVSASYTVGSTGVAIVTIAGAIKHKMRQGKCKLPAANNYPSSASSAPSSENSMTNLFGRHTMGAPPSAAPRRTQS